MEPKTPLPVTREKCLELMEQDKFTAQQELTRFKNEYERKTKGGLISNAYTKRVKEYIDIFQILCQEEESAKPESTSA